MAFYVRICDEGKGVDIKSHKLPFILFVTQKYMLETLDDCYDFVVNATEESTINIFEKLIFKKQCFCACYKIGKLVIAIMANDKFDNKSIGKLIVKLRREYLSNPTFSHKELDNFIEDSQEVKPDKLGIIQNNLNDTIKIMVKNIDEVIKRGESLESLGIKADDLNNEATKFKKRTKNSICPECVLS